MNARTGSPALTSSPGCTTGFPRCPRPGAGVPPSTGLCGERRPTPAGGLVPRHRPRPSRPGRMQRRPESNPRKKSPSRRHAQEEPRTQGPLAPVAMSGSPKRPETFKVTGNFNRYYILFMKLSKIPYTVWLLFTVIKLLITAINNHFFRCLPSLGPHYLSRTSG